MKPAFKHSFGLVIVLIFLFSVAAFRIALAMTEDSDSEFETGVKAGDWLLYQVFATDTIMENMEWAKVEILNVSGTNITYHVTIHYNNIPEDNLTVNCDMRKLMSSYEFLYGNLAGSSPLFVPLSFTAQNFTFDFMKITLDLPSDWREDWNFSRTTREFAGVKRQVNMINESSVSSYDAGYVQSMYGETCWDAQTGVLSEARGISHNPFPIGGVDPKTVEKDTLLKIVDTNLWEMPHLSSNQAAKTLAFAGLLGCILLIPTAAIVWRKKMKQDE